MKYTCDNFNNSENENDCFQHQMLVRFLASFQTYAFDIPGIMTIIMKKI